jgi:hypothetical protein
MNKSVVLTVVLTMLILTASVLSVAFADVSVGVKKGDWIKYQVRETGNPTPDFNVTWARMDVTAVQSEKITVDVQTGYANGTIYPEPQIHLNLATGAVGDGFFMPKEFNIGDQFYSEYQGNITITSILQQEVGGAMRTVVSASTNQTTFYWDRQTGILVGATTSFPNFTLFTKTSATNIWQPQIIGLDLTMFYLLIVVVVIFFVAITAILVWRLKVQNLHFKNVKDAVLTK